MAENSHIQNDSHLLLQYRSSNGTLFLPPQKAHILTDIRGTFGLTSILASFSSSPDLNTVEDCEVKIKVQTEAHLVSM